MRKSLWIVCLFMAACTDSRKYEDSFEGILQYNADHAGTDIQKITCLSRLAWYYMEVNKRQSDSVMQSAYALAVKSDDDKKRPLVLCYLLDAERHLLLDDYKDHVDSVALLASQAKRLANSYNLSDYEAFSWLYLAQAAALSGSTLKNIEDDFGEADKLGSEMKNDSLQLEIMNIRSQVYQRLRLLNEALSNASKAIVFAEDKENKNYKIIAFRRLAHLYEDIDSTQAVGNLETLVKLCNNPSSKEDLIWANIELGRYYLAMPNLSGQAYEFLRKAQDMSGSIKHKTLIMQTHFEFIDYYIKSGHPDSAISYINTHSKWMKDYYRNNGLAARFYYRYATRQYDLAEYYRKTRKNMPVSDSNYYYANDYFLQSEKAYDSKESVFRKSMMEYYFGTINYRFYYLNKPKLRNNNLSDYQYDSLLTVLSDYYRKADTHFYNAEIMNNQLNDPENIRNVLSWREDLALDSAAYYYRIFNPQTYPGRKPLFDYYGKAFRIRSIYDSCDFVFQNYKDSKAQFKTEALRVENLAKVAAEKQQQKDKTKLVGIIFTLAVVFMALILGGYLRVSMTVTKGLNFFAFIFLFEFILLLTEKWVHEITHGEMVSSLLIKIAFGIILVPLHHYLEEKVIRSIRNRNLAREI